MNREKDENYVKCDDFFSKIVCNSDFKSDFNVPAFLHASEFDAS